MSDLITDDLARLIWQLAMGSKVVVISSDNDLASERFREIREAIIEAEDKMRALMEEAERELIYGQPTGINPMGMMEYFEQIEALPVDNPIWQRKWYNPKNWRPIRKVRESVIQCRRCRWRPRESRRKLEGLSPGVVVIDEYAFTEEG